MICIMCLSKKSKCRPCSLRWLSSLMVCNYHFWAKEIIERKCNHTYGLFNSSPFYSHSWNHYLSCHSTNLVHQIDRQIQMDTEGNKRTWLVRPPYQMLFHLQTSYLVPRYNLLMCIQWPKCLWRWPKVKVKGQGQNFPQNGLNVKQLAISWMLFHLQTSYLVPRYNPIRHIQWPKCQWPWPWAKVIGQGHCFPKMGKKPKNWSYFGGYFTYRLHTWYQGTT